MTDERKDIEHLINEGLRRSGELHISGLLRPSDFLYAHIGAMWLALDRAIEESKRDDETSR